MYDRILSVLTNLAIYMLTYMGSKKQTNKKLSTYVALQSVVDNLTHALANGEQAHGVYSDFSRAFTLWTIWYCCKSCIALVFVVVLIIGSLVIWQTDQNVLLIMGSNLILIIFNVVYQKFYTGTTFLFFNISMIWHLHVKDIPCLICW